MLYEAAGMREYWLVNPSFESVFAYYCLTEKGQFELIRQQPFSGNEPIPVHIFDGFELDLDEVFR